MLEALFRGRGEIFRRLRDRLTLAAVIWLAVGLATSAFVIWAFAELADGVVEGESGRFDRAVLIWIHAYSPEWLEAPMRLVTTLGYYWVVLPLLAAVAVGFYGTLTLILAYRLRGFARWAVVACGVSLVLLIGFSRLYLGVHYPTDVLAGFLAAPLWVIFVGVVYAVWLSVRGLRAAESKKER
ncbi:MAG: phosphatase PAP2 family protein [Actinobacteria bacterium]|nr:phosphatase PAP2 family protein [Actinomycetota bacterium]